MRSFAGIDLVLQSPIGYTTGLVIAGLLLVVLWCLIKIDYYREKTAKDKAVRDLENKIKF
ncbi:MAG: hypothetical protein IEMM0002_0251 [bacterium]|nr:MAG: hypothetical protein IEMM0002_0251 [bacterium]